MQHREKEEHWKSNVGLLGEEAFREFGREGGREGWREGGGMKEGRGVVSYFLVKSPGGGATSPSGFSQILAPYLMKC